MVTLTRLSGSAFALNPDLVERIDQTPDTIITLVDGTKYLVEESLDEVVAAILEYRASVVALAGTYDRPSEGAFTQRGRLSAVPTEHEAPVVPLPQSEA